MAHEPYVREVFEALQLRDRRCGALMPVKEAYTFGEMIAVGGMSLIASLVPVDSQESPAVLKILCQDAPPHLRGLLRRENDILRNCASPYVVEWRGYAETECGLPALLLEQLGGGRTLLEHAVERGRSPLPLERVCALFEQCVQAVRVAHGSSIGHRDLKPSNFVVTADERVKLIDFMLAGYVREWRFVSCGTPEYHTPEASDSSGVRLLEDDLFALTLILAEMLSGRMLGGEDVSRKTAFTAVIARSREEKLRRLHDEASRFGKELADFIRKGTNLDPKKRFGSIDEMGTAFDFATINI